MSANPFAPLIANWMVGRAVPCPPRKPAGHIRHPSSILHPPSSLFLLALCLWLAAANPLSAANANADAAPPSGDLLQFLNGSVLHGALKSVDAAHGLLWQHPDAKAPFDLIPAHVDFVRFPQAKSLALTPSCHIRFAGGDDLYGSLVSLDGETMQFNTWFGGTMKIPRAAIQTVTFLPKNYSIVYEGPEDAADWVITSGRQSGGLRIRGANGGVFNGNIVIMGGGQLVLGGGLESASAPPPGPPNWTYRDGSFVTAGVGTLGRNFNLAGSSTIEFDLACNGPFNLLLNLYSTSLDRAEMNNNSFLVELESADTGQLAMLRARGFNVANELHNVILTNFDLRGKPERVTLNCNREEGSLSLLVDGLEVKRWSDIGSFDDLGGGLVVQNQQQAATVKLSKWEGRYGPDTAPAGATNADMVSFINYDKAGGKIEGIAGGKLDLNLGGSVLHIPSARVRRIDFAQSSAVPEPRGPWEVRAVFPGGGSVSFQLEKWDDQSVAGHSALFGAVAFQPGSIRELQFNLDRLRAEPAPTLDNEFDALDQ